MSTDVFCKDTTLLPGMYYLIDFVDTKSTVHNFRRRAKLISWLPKKNLKKTFVYFF